MCLITFGWQAFHRPLIFLVVLAFVGFVVTGARARLLQVVATELPPSPEKSCSRKLADEKPVSENTVYQELTNRTYPSRDNTNDLYALGGWRKG